MPDKKLNIRNALDALLDETKISQAELARRAGCSEAYVSKLRHGHKTDCTVGVLYRLSEQLGGSAAFQILAMAMHADMQHHELEVATIHKALAR